MPQNPFVNNVQCDHILILLLKSPLALVRIFLFGASYGLAYLLSTTAVTIDDDTRHPMSGFRKSLKKGVEKLVIYAHSICPILSAFQVKVSGTRAPPWVAPILILAPHSSFFDPLPYSVIGAPSVVGKKDLFDSPIAGRILRLTIPYFIDRANKDARDVVKHVITKRAAKVLARETYNGVEWPQIGIFPEATTTNRTQLITFKPGAFYAKMPVQPVCFNWIAQSDSISWTWEGAGWPTLFWLSMSSLKIKLEITYLPVYYPSEEEKADACLYANNVREIMARHLKIPTSIYAFEDVPYLTSIKRAKKENFWILCEKAGIESFNGNANEQLRIEWDGIKDRNEFSVNLSDFASFCGKEENYLFTRLFVAFDWLCTGFIDIREYLMTRYSAESESSETFLTLAYEMLTMNGEAVNEDNFIKMIRFPYEFSIRDCRLIYKAFRKNDISYEEIFNALVKHGRFSQMNRS